MAILFNKGRFSGKYFRIDSEFFQLVVGFSTALKIMGLLIQAHRHRDALYAVA